MPQISSQTTESNKENQSPMSRGLVDGDPLPSTVTIRKRKTNIKQHASGEVPFPLNWFEGGKGADASIIQGISPVCQISGNCDHEDQNSGNCDHEDQNSPSSEHHLSQQSDLGSTSPLEFNANRVLCFKSPKEDSFTQPFSVDDGEKILIESRSDESDDSVVDLTAGVNGLELGMLSPLESLSNENVVRQHMMYSTPLKRINPPKTPQSKFKVINMVQSDDDSPSKGAENQIPTPHSDSEDYDEDNDDSDESDDDEDDLIVNQLGDTIQKHANSNFTRAEKREFKRKREVKSSELLKQFDNSVFEDQLSSKVTIQWSNTLRTTAGMCRLKRTKYSNLCTVQRSAIIILASKVVDNEQRLAKTLLHELCHAAAWVIDGVKKPPHGEDFQRWGMRSFLVTGLPVKRCHNYQVSYKHHWTCIGHSHRPSPTFASSSDIDNGGMIPKGCGAIIGRHSKSIDPLRHVCASCKGKLKYIGNRHDTNMTLEQEGEVKPKPQPPFAKFVKDHYKEAKLAVQLDKRSRFTAEGFVRQRAPSPRSPLPPVAHQEVMSHLSKQWKASRNPVIENEIGSE